MIGRAASFFAWESGFSGFEALSFQVESPHEIDPIR
jgi:hypothetical protein